MEHSAKRAFEFLVGRKDRLRFEGKGVANGCACSAPAVRGTDASPRADEHERESQDRGLHVVAGVACYPNSLNADLESVPPLDASVEKETAARAAEGALIDKVLGGHKESFLDLIRPHQRTVYATAMSLLTNKDDAEDVVQTAMLKGLAKLAQFRRESAFGTWLVQITINEVRMRKRRDRRAEMLSLTPEKVDAEGRAPLGRDFEDWREIPSEALERAEIRDVLAKALESLELHYREAFVLRDLHELSVADTARILGISRGAVKTRLHRARLRLREILSPGYGPGGRLRLREARNPWE